LEDKFVVPYAGIHGIAQGLEHLVEAAKLFAKPREDITSTGEGPRKAIQPGSKEGTQGFEESRCCLKCPPRCLLYRSAADCDIVPLRDFY